MKFTVEKTVLVAGLQRIQGIVQARSTMPILSNVRIVAEKKGVQLFATDLEIGLQNSIAADVQEEGRTTVSAKKLFEIAREAKEESLRISSQDGQGIVIRAGKSSFKLRGLPAEEFPSFPVIKETGRTQVSAAALREMIRKTAYSISSDLTRMALNGALLHFPSKGKPSLEMVATDGHRLSLVTRSLAEKGLEKKSLKIIVPKKTLFELKKYLDEGEGEEIEIVLSENHVLFRDGTYTLLSRLIDAKFPNYEEVIPKENPKEVLLEREAFLGAIRRVSILSDEKTHTIKLTFNKGELRISSSNPEMGEAEETLPADYPDEETNFGFNVRYIQEVTSALQGEEIRLRCLDSTSPILIEDPSDEGFVGVIMPMRI
jgi:DNA polymerase-3 subunit beta